MNCLMFPLNLAPIAETTVQHWDPPMTLIGKLLAIAVLVLLNGFFVAAEFALVKIRTSHLKTVAASGSSRAGLLRTIKDNLNSYLSACQVGITMASLGLGWLGEPFLARMLQPFFTLAGINLPPSSNRFHSCWHFRRSRFCTSWWGNKHQRFWRSAKRCLLLCS